MRSSARRRSTVSPDQPPSGAPAPGAARPDAATVKASAGAATRAPRTRDLELKGRTGALPPPSPEAAVMAAREAARQCRQPRRAARDPRPLRRLRAAHDGDPAGVRRRQSASARDVRRRSARTRRGHRGPAVRRPLGQAARPHAGGDRARPQVGLYRQHRAVAAARQPRSRRRRNRPSACPSYGARSSSRIPTCWFVSASRPRSRCSTSRTAFSRRADAGSPTTPGHARSAPPTLHPAYLLRQPLQKRLAWRDFLAIKKALAT